MDAGYMGHIQQQQQQQAMLPDEEMQRHLEEYNRSVTIIIWYKPNTEPIRLQQFLPTFPYFRLATFEHLTSDLGLSAGSYLDTFIPASGQWEQHTIQTVRQVEAQQRIIYKLRRSLIDPLHEDECPTLRDELQIQRSIRRDSYAPPAEGQESSSTASTSGKAPNGDNHTKNTLKRPAPQHDQDTGHPAKVHVPNSFYVSSQNAEASGMVANSPGDQGSDSSSPALSSQTPNQSQANSMYLSYQNPVFYGGGGGPGAPHNDPLPDYLITPLSPPAPIPYRPHPPLKRWPNDYTVSELSNGFHAMDLLISQSPPGHTMTQKIAFERVFGSRYVKSTVCRHRAVWRRAPRALRESFEEMGTDEAACWGEFVRRVENRPPNKSAQNGGEIMSPVTPQSVPANGYQPDIMSPGVQQNGSANGYQQGDIIAPVPTQAGSVNGYQRDILAPVSSQNGPTNGYQHAPSDEDAIHGQESVMNSLVQDQGPSNGNPQHSMHSMNGYETSHPHHNSSSHNVRQP